MTEQERALGAPAAGQPKHTPGPWFVQTNGNDLPTIHTRPTGWDVCIVHPGCESDGGVCGRTQEETDANAKLIASAPAMVDALRRIRYIAGHKSATPDSDYVRIYREATDALPAGDLLRYPDQAASQSEPPKAPPKALEMPENPPPSDSKG